MITFEQGIETILARARVGRRRRVLPIAEAAGYVLADEIRSDTDMPAFNRSAMDGFAYRHADRARGDSFRIAGAVAAGEARQIDLDPGECVKIMTGAPVPDSADTVIPVEDTSAFVADPAASDEGRPATHGMPPGRPFARDSEVGETVRFAASPDRGANIARRGEDLQVGQTVLREGHLLRAQEIAALAAVGRATVAVYAGPTAAFGATGEEIVEPGSPLGSGQIRNSNAYSLWSQILQARAEPDYLGIIGDRAELLREQIVRGLERDILILSGGVSMGEFDLVPGILAEAGVAIHFRKLQVRPGRPMLFGSRGETLVFGLPGNPISTLLAFDQYVLPVIRTFRHHPQPVEPIRSGRLAEPVKTPAKWLTFVACRTEWREGEYWLTPKRTHGSADIFAIAGADAVALIPVGTTELPRGATVDFRRLYQP